MDKGELPNYELILIVELESGIICNFPKHQKNKSFSMEYTSKDHRLKQILETQIQQINPQKLFKHSKVSSYHWTITDANFIENT